YWTFVCSRGTPNSDDDISTCGKLPVTDRNSQRVCSRPGERGLGTRRGGARQRRTVSAHHTPAVGQDSAGQAIVCSYSDKCGGGWQCARLTRTRTHQWSLVDDCHRHRGLDLVRISAFNTGRTDCCHHVVISAAAVYTRVIKRSSAKCRGAV